MVTSFEIENQTTKERIKFGQEIDCDFLYKSGGIDWGNAPATHNTYNYPNQVGVSISTSKIDTRDVYITAYAFYVMNDSELKNISRSDWENYVYSKVKAKKKKLNDIINPSDYIRIYVGGYYLEGKPQASVKYGTEDTTNNNLFCQFTFQIYCNNPMFKKDTITRTVLSGDTPVFHFPFILIPKMMIMGTRIDYLMLAVENEGNVSIGGKIILKSSGVVKNPKITNVLTGETITVKKTMQAGERIVINTVDGKDRGITGYYQGVEQSYLQYWSFENTWFKFLKGTTLIGYETENQSENSLDVSIEINPEKFGLEEE